MQFCTVQNRKTLVELTGLFGGKVIDVTADQVSETSVNGMMVVFVPPMAS